jgi:hypothetical protein
MVFMTSPIRPGEFPIEASRPPPPSCLWHRLAQKVIAKASDKRHTSGRQMRAREKTALAACAWEGRGSCARTGNRVPTLPRGTPHRCSPPVERGGKRGEGEEKRAAAGPGIACGRNGGCSVFAQESRTYTSLSDPICAARGSGEREGEEGGGTSNHSRRCGASIQLRSHLCPAAPMPSAATNPVRLHLHPGARRLVPRVVLRSASSSSQSARSARTSSSPFLCSIAYAWLAWTWIYYALFCFLR